jgi:hypothetical protein
MDPLRAVSLTATHSLSAATAPLLLVITVAERPD